MNIKIVRKSSLLLLAILCLSIFTGCNEDVQVDAIYITAAEKSSTVSFSAKESGDALGITISSALVTRSDVVGRLFIDNSLVERYNKEHGENYQSLPEGTCSLSGTTLTITQDNYRSDAVTLQVNDIEAVKKGVNYLLPVKLVSESKNYPGLPGSDVLYVVINRAIMTNVPRFGGNNYFKVNFSDEDIKRLQNLDEFTFEIRVNLWDFPIYGSGRGLMAIMGYPESEDVEKNAWLFVDGTPDRVGGDGNVPVFMFATKQWAIYAGKLGFPIEKDVWYHVAGVYANKKLSLYLDGLLFSEVDYEKPMSFTKNFYIGGNPDRPNGHLRGYASEARFWTRALTPVELRNPLHRCIVEVDSEGLEGYWKLDDMSETCNDYTGHGHIAVKQGTGRLEWIQEVPCP